MMSYILSIVMMVMLNFYSLWLSEYIYYILFYMFLLINIYNNIYLNLSYMFGIDLLSYLMLLLLLLLFWICNLMILVIKNKSLKNMFIFDSFIILMFILCI